MTATNDLGYLVRSEERLKVTTERTPARRVRLEKFVVTETRTITVEVSREEFRLVELHLTAEDVTSGQQDEPGPEAPDRWMTLSEERVVITKEVVALERVRLQRSDVTEQRTVTEQVRREQVDLEPTINTDPTEVPPASNSEEN